MFAVNRVDKPDTVTPSLLSLSLVGPHPIDFERIAPGPLLDDLRQAAFMRWRVAVSRILLADRGRASRLARFLGVSRQRVSQWFVLHHRDVPGWVVMATLEFLERENTLPDVRHPASQRPQSPHRGTAPGANVSIRLRRAFEFACAGQAPSISTVEPTPAPSQTQLTLSL